MGLDGLRTTPWSTCVFSCVQPSESASSSFRVAERVQAERTCCSCRSSLTDGKSLWLGRPKCRRVPPGGGHGTPPETPPPEDSCVAATRLLGRLLDSAERYGAQHQESPSESFRWLGYPFDKSDVINTWPLSGERLMTQLEMITSATPSATGKCSISPRRNSTFSFPFA